MAGHALSLPLNPILGMHHRSGVDASVGSCFASFLQRIAWFGEESQNGPVQVEDQHSALLSMQICTDGLIDCSLFFLAVVSRRQHMILSLNFRYRKFHVQVYMHKLITLIEKLCGTAMYCNILLKLAASFLHTGFLNFCPLTLQSDIHRFWI
jgi:hypothetical protein